MGEKKQEQEGPCDNFITTLSNSVPVIVFVQTSFSISFTNVISFYFCKNVSQ